VNIRQRLARLERRFPPLHAAASPEPDDGRHQVNTDPEHLAEVLRILFEVLGGEGLIALLAERGFAWDEAFPGSRPQEVLARRPTDHPDLG
jgi:hypothetical protein